MEFIIFASFCLPPGAWRLPPSASSFCCLALSLYFFSLYLFSPYFFSPYFFSPYFFSLQPGLP
jgi:hypothetical protein